MRIRIILKRFALVAAVACSMAGLAGCYDDAELLKQLEEQERRLASLDQACAQMNTNIASLKVILRALQENDYISSTAPIVQEGKIIGYGDHDHLLRTCPTYREIYKSQMGDIA